MKNNIDILIRIMLNLSIALSSWTCNCIILPNNELWGVISIFEFKDFKTFFTYICMCVCVNVYTRIPGVELQADVVAGN